MVPEWSVRLAELFLYAVYALFAVVLLIALQVWLWVMIGGLVKACWDMVRPKSEAEKRACREEYLSSPGYRMHQEVSRLLDEKRRGRDEDGDPPE